MFTSNNESQILIEVRRYLDHDRKMKETFITTYFLFILFYYRINRTMKFFFVDNLLVLDSKKRVFCKFKYRLKI